MRQILIKEWLYIEPHHPCTYHIRNWNLPGSPDDSRQTHRYCFRLPQVIYAKGIARKLLGLEILLCNQRCAWWASILAVCQILDDIAKVLARQP